jgi:nicotinamidase-related amidase
MSTNQLPLPPHYDPNNVGLVWRVPYQERFQQALQWAQTHHLSPAIEDQFRICLILVDVQNTFCIPNFELFVAGRSGNGAVEDNRRLSAFIYRNLPLITEISPTMDTHQAMQIFHSIFLVDENGEHPPAYTLVSEEDIEHGRWRINPALLPILKLDARDADRYLRHYVHSLSESGKFDLTIWPYHAMLGGIGHALVSAIEEAIFFHTIARNSQPDYQIKGDNPLTEHYSVIGPEVTEDDQGRKIAKKNQAFIDKLTQFDMMIIAGQAKSHCVAWTIDDLLHEVLARDEFQTKKVYLLEDCTSPVVIPGVVDYTEEADRAFQRYADAGMHVVRSTDPIAGWPEVELD